MTLDEAIAHAREVAKKNREDAKYWNKVKGVGVFTDENAEHLLKKCEECAKEHEQLADWLEELKARREAEKWIPVSESLPKIGNASYLVTVDYGKGIIATCERFFFNDEIGWNDDCVIAWRPLPEPYESEGEE